MLVNLKNNSFEAVQWLKAGDHPAVYYHKERTGLAVKAGYYVDESNEELPTNLDPGDWIVKLLGTIHVYSDDEFRKMFVKAGFYSIHDQRCWLCTGDLNPPYACGADTYCCGNPEIMKVALEAKGETK